jgi:acyl-CoA ligase (AMP-forming) (exosortase A-associated)
LRQEAAVPDPDPTPFPLDRLTLRGEPDAPALLTREGLLDYAGLERAVGSLAAALATDWAPGTMIASWLPKNRLASLLPLACARSGLIHIPINPLLKRSQVMHILRDSGADLLISNEARIATLDAEAQREIAFLVEEQHVARYLDCGEHFPPSDRDPDGLVQLLYTSGSTGGPKGVMLSHANLWLGAVSVAHYLRLEPADRVLGVLPLSFDYGQNQLLSAWAAGACAVPLDYLAARDVIRAVEAHGITTLAGVPPLWVQLIEAVWPPRAALSLRRLTNSGGRLPVSVVRRMRELFPAAEIHLMYGLTEAFRSTSLDPALLDSHPDSIGTAIPFADVMTSRPDGSPALPGEEGELVQSGPLVAHGYWNDAARTAARFRPAPDGRRAVWSGDRVRQDSDGLIYFVGRDDAMIKASGNRVSPTEIEEAAVASGAVAEAVALGYPDDRLGEAIALVVRGNGEEAALRAWLRRELPNFMQPSAILWRDALPRSANGKIDRERLKWELTA